MDKEMKRLWQYQDFVGHLSHENELVRERAFRVLNTRFLNRYTDQVAVLLTENDVHLVCAAFRYLVHHQAVQYAPAILEKFINSDDILAANAAEALANLSYEPALESLLDRLDATENAEVEMGIIQSLGKIKNEKARAALKKCLDDMSDPYVAGLTINNLMNHHHPEDVALIMEKCFGNPDMDFFEDRLLDGILTPLDASPYFFDLKDYGTHFILSKPMATIDAMIDQNGHLSLDSGLINQMANLIKAHKYVEFAEFLGAEVRQIVQARYPDGQVGQWSGELMGKDVMGLQVLEFVTANDTVWRQVLKAKFLLGDYLSMILSVYLAVIERAAYQEAFHPDAGIEQLMSALQNCGPRLPEKIQQNIKVLSPVQPLIEALSEELTHWKDIWIVRLMGMIGSREFVPSLVRVLRQTDDLAFIHNDALQSIDTLEEAADEGLFAAVKNRELDAWQAFGILARLPYAEAFDLAEEFQEKESDGDMDIDELYVNCLEGIGDRRGIEKLQEVWNEINDDPFVGQALEYLSVIHDISIPELPEIKESREEWRKNFGNKINPFQGWLDSKPDDDWLDSKYDDEDDFDDFDFNTPYKRDIPKIGRNEPCPCGSGKKYKKCCLNK